MKRSFKQTLGGRQGQPEAPAEGGEVRRDIEPLLKKYSGMSESELMRELKEATGRQKAEGRFDEASVKKGMDAIMPMLSDEQKKKLFDIMGML